VDLFAVDGGGTDRGDAACPVSQGCAGTGTVFAKMSGPALHRGARGNSGLSGSRCAAAHRGADT